jgi:uracil phosphoribosyltransferase
LCEAVRQIIPGCAVGKILIQRDEEDPEKRPKLFYSKLPPNISQMTVILVDPMLATGGSAIMAIEVLHQAGVREESVQFLNVVCAPEGLKALALRYPNVQVVTAAVD